MLTWRRVMMGEELRRYTNTYGEVEGFMMPETAVIWDFLLIQQRRMNITGDFLEIGVYKGKSALLGGLYLRDDELALLVDICDILTVRDELARLSVKVRIFQGKSADLKMCALFNDRISKVRWFHIDGDHSGYSTYNDLCLAEQFISDLGIICVDDFCNPRYPQLNAAIFKFLLERPFSFKMVLCGLNKCYIVHSGAYPVYEDLIRKHMASHFRGNGFKNLTISKTGYAHDMGCFSVEPRIRDLDYIGLDYDVNNIVF